MRVQIKDKDLELKYGFRAMMLYEKITDKSFMPQGLFDVVMFFYASVLAADRELILSLDEFLDWLDENPHKAGEFSDWLIASIEQQNTLSSTLKEKMDAESKKKSKMQPKKTKSTK